MGLRSECLAVVLIAWFAGGAHLPPNMCEIYESPGDVYIGGIFSLHEPSGKSNNSGSPKCARRRPVSALQLTEAMAYAVHTVNRDDTVLAGVTLGFVVLDDCHEDAFAMWDSLVLTMGAKSSPKGERCQIPGPVDAATNATGNHHERLAMGIVGTERTSSSEIVASTAGLFQRPMVSYGATGQELHAKTSHPEYFFSTLSTDRERAQAIFDLLDYFGWKYVGLVYSDDYDTLNLAQEVSALSGMRQVCIDVQAKVGEVPSEADLSKLVCKLLDSPSAQVVLLLVSSPTAASAVMSAVARAEPTPLSVTWLVSDSWNQDARDLDEVDAVGGIFIRNSSPFLANFEQYFQSFLAEKSRTISAENSNPWFEEFCGADGGVDRCRAASEDGFSKSVLGLAATIDAVLALSHALDKTIQERSCDDLSSIGLCLSQNGVGEVLLGYLKESSFQGTRGHFQFVGNWVPGQFNVTNLQSMPNGTFERVEVGTWTSSSLAEHPRPPAMLILNESQIQWRLGSVLGPDGVTPKSNCREECAPGFTIAKHLTKKCCWVCLECEHNEITVNSSTKCQECLRTEFPESTNRTTCLKLNEHYISWQDSLSIIMVSLSCMGLLMCAVAAGGMLIHRRQPVIKASSRELSCVNITGLVLSYVTVFVVLSPPLPSTCTAAQVMYALSFTLMNSSIFLKVNRIYRIFETSIKSTKPPRFTGPLAQLVIVFVMVLVQAFIMVITAVAVPGTWSTILRLPPPSVPHGDDLQQHRYIEIFCSLSEVGFLTAMAYNVLIQLACCLFAFKARGVPGNYNEARFYAANVFTTVVLVVAALPVYVVADTAIMLALSVNLLLIANGYMTLLCVYLPKLYAVRFEKLGVAQTESKPKERRLTPKEAFGMSVASTSMMESSRHNKVHPTTID